MRWKWWSPLRAGVVCTVLIAASPASGDDARRALSGAWMLNARLSDSVQHDGVAEERLVLTLGDRTVTFYQRDGSWQAYQLSGRRERRDLGSGPVWTTATWNGSTLRLQIDGARGLTVIQTFSIEPQTGRLVVVSTPDPRRLPMNAVRLVYDPVIDRTP